MGTTARCMARRVLAALAVTAAILISGCGGGGGSSAVEPAPMPVPPAPQGPAGTLDPSFGTGGTVSTQVGDHGTFASTILVQPDNKIVVAGGALVSVSAGRALIRYNEDGTLDSTFGSGGKVFTTEAGFTGGAALQSDGKIITAGTWGASGPADHSVLARFRSDGSLDPAFGVGGVVAAQLTNPDSTPLPTNGGAVALQADGKSVVAAAATSKIGAMRFNADGNRDTSFGAGGSVVVSTMYAPVPNTAIAVQPDGKTLVAGISIDPSPGLQVRGDEVLLMRLETTGALDASFGQGGVVRILRNEGAFLIGAKIALRGDGKILVLGVWGQVLRLLPNGAPDSTFGEGGAAHDVYGGAVAVQSNGKVVVAGFSPPINGASNFTLWRLASDGLPDSSFGSGGTGMVVNPIGKSAGPLAIQQDGRIVVGGATYSSPLDLIVARYFGYPVAVASP